MPVISTNLAANSAVRYLNINSASQTSSLSKLASGSRITQASDDAAGLAISTKISSDVTALNQAATNASHGISVLQTADGGASNISDILQRMKALASQASSGTVTNNERAYIDAEFQQLIDEVDAIAVGTRYNGQSLLDGTSAFAGAGINVMVGSDAADVITVTLDTLNASGLGLRPAPAGDTVTGTAGVAAIPADPGSAAVAGTDAVATGTVDIGAGAGLAAINAGGTFTVNGTTVTIPSGGTAANATDALAVVVAAFAAAVPPITDVTPTLGAGDVLVLTQVGNTTAEAAVTLGGTDLADFMGTATSATGTGLTAAVPPTAAVPAVAAGSLTINATAAGITATEDMSFELNGTLVTLNAAADADSNGSWSATEIAATINAALAAATPPVTTLNATVAGDTVVIANTDPAAGATTVIDTFSANANAADFGLTADAAGPAAPGLATLTQAGAVAALTVLDTAISTVSNARANIGSLESRFGFHQASIATSVENLTAAVSAIRDTDVAQEAAKLASSKVKTQAAVAAAAQASQMPQDLLKLLQ